jgi:hypothetical protein
MESDERIIEAVKNTEIVRLPKQNLSTFGATNIYYYLVARASYNEMVNQNETVIREGRVIAERPRIVTPSYLSRVQGFSDEAKKYYEMLMNRYSPDSPGIYYGYRNEPKEMNIVSDDIPAVIERLQQQIDQKGDQLTSIIKGEDMLWDVSIIKFIYELTQRSLTRNINEMNQMGLLNVDRSGVTGDARNRIEQMFDLVKSGEMDPSDLKSELDRWDVFEEYQDRFLALFTGKR